MWSHLLGTPTTWNTPGHFLPCFAVKIYIDYRFSFPSATLTMTTHTCAWPAQSLQLLREKPLATIQKQTKFTGAFYGLLAGKLVEAMLAHYKA